MRPKQLWPGSCPVGARSRNPFCFFTCPLPPPFLAPCCSQNVLRVPFLKSVPAGGGAAELPGHSQRRQRLPGARGRVEALHRGQRPTAAAPEDAHGAASNGHSTSAPAGHLWHSWFPTCPLPLSHPFLICLRVRHFGKALAFCSLWSLHFGAFAPGGAPGCSRPAYPGRSAPQSAGPSARTRRSPRPRRRGRGPPPQRPGTAVRATRAPHPRKAPHARVALQNPAPCRRPSHPQRRSALLTRLLLPPASHKAKASSRDKQLPPCTTK